MIDETGPHWPDDAAKVTSVPVPAPARAPSKVGRGILAGVLVGVVSVGASIMSCVGQSFAHRQAVALEGIEQRLDQLLAPPAVQDLGIVRIRRSYLAAPLDLTIGLDGSVTVGRTKLPGSCETGSLAPPICAFGDAIYDGCHWRCPARPR